MKFPEKMCPIWKCVYVTWVPIVAYANIPIYILWVPFDVHTHDNKMVSLHKERLIRSWLLLQLLPLLIIQMSLEVAHAGNEQHNLYTWLTSQLKIIYISDMISFHYWIFRASSILWNFNWKTFKQRRGNLRKNICRG